MSINVLVVDSSNESRSTLVEFLGTAGISSVTEASDFDAAINQSSQGSYDAVLVNWNTSTQGDSSLIQELRENGTNSPIFLVSDESETELAQQTHGSQVKLSW
jgi:DNA-binding response OmpR family regulator